MAAYALVPTNNNNNNGLPLPSSSKEEENNDQNNIQSSLSSVYSTYAKSYPNPSLLQEAHVKQKLLQQIATLNAASNPPPPPPRSFLSFLFGPPPPPPPPPTDETKDQVEYYLQQTPPQTTATTNDDEEEGWLDWDCIPEEACMMARFHLISSRLKSNINTINPPTIPPPPQEKCRVVKGVLVDFGIIGEYQTLDDGRDIVMMTETSDRSTLVVPCSREKKRLEYARATYIGTNMLAISWGYASGVIILYRRVFIEGSKIGWDAVVKIGVSDAVLNTAQKCVTIPTTTSAEPQPRKKKWGNKEEDGMIPTVQSSGLIRVTEILPLIVYETITSPTTSSSTPPPTATLAIARLGGYLELIPLPLKLWHGPILTLPPHLSAKHYKANPHLHNHALLPDLVSTEKVAAVSTSLHHLDIMTMSAVKTSVGSETEWDCTKYPDGPPAEFIVSAVGTATPPLPTPQTKDESMVEEEEEEENVEAGGSCVTLWGISTVYEETPQREEEEDATFHVHVGFLSKVEIENVGPGVTLFVNPLNEEEENGENMAKMWRKSRQYTIQQRVVNKSGEDYQEEEKVVISEEINKQMNTAATLSTEAPITSLFFSTTHHTTTTNNQRDNDSSSSDSNVDTSSPPPLLLATLDYNGGISILDCTSVSLSAIHEEEQSTKAAECTLAATNSIHSKNNKKKNQEEKELEDPPLPPHEMEMALLHPRERMMLLQNRYDVMNQQQCKKKKKIKNLLLSSSSKMMDTVIHASWWDVADATVHNDDDDQQQQLPLLATVTSSGTFTLWSFRYHDYPKIIFQTSITEHHSKQSLHKNTAMFSSTIHYGPSLPFLFRILNNSSPPDTPPLSSSSLMLCAIQKVQPQTLISSLIQKRQYEEALSMASQFHYQENYGNDGLLDCCYKHFWEVHRDVKMLKMILEDGYVINVAWRLEKECGKEVEEEDGGLQYLEEVRDVWREGLERCRRVMEEKRDGDVTLASFEYEQHDDDDGKDGSVMEYVSSKLQSNIILLGTYILMTQRIHGSAAAAASSIQFFTKFMHISIKDLALSIAKRGDVDALITLLIRHADVLQYNEVRMEILDILPLGLTIELGFVRHLLPCLVANEEEKQNEDQCCFFVIDPPSGGETGGENEFPPIKFLKVKELAYFIRDVSRGIVESSSMFGGFGTGRSSVALFTDELDEEEVLRRVSSLCNDINHEADENTASREDIAKWYCDRAITLHEFTGQVMPVMELCTLGLDRLGIGRQQRQTQINGSYVEKLHVLRAQAFHLNQLLVGNIIPTAPISTSYPPKASLSEEFTLEQFESLDLEGLVPLILGFSDNETDEINDANEIVSRYQRYLRPMVDKDNFHYMSCWEDESYGILEEDTDDGLNSTLGRCIASCCLKRVRNAVTANGHTASLSSPKLQSALSLCCKFASASQTAIQKNDRVIQTPNVLIQFVVDVIIAVSSGEGGDTSASFSVLESFWNLYECLPLRVPSLEEKDEAFAALQQKIDRLYVYLIILEILSKWCKHGSSSALSSFPIDIEAIYLWEEGEEESKFDDHFRQTTGVTNGVGGEESTPYSHFIALGCKVVAAASEGFCRRIQLLSMLPPEQQPKQQHDLILDFISDIDGLDQQCFHSCLDIGPILELHLLLPLLQQHSFQALKVVLQTCPVWFDASVVESCILAYVYEAALFEKPTLSPTSHHIGADRAKSIQNAIDCQDVLGPFFPNLHPEFDTMRRYLDAAHFMQNVLHCSNDSSLLEPAILKITPPTQIVEVFLAENQHSMILGCTDWSKPEFAAKANFDISCHLAPKDASSSQEALSKSEPQDLPPPPGGYVLHLAGILGLQSEYEQFIVMNLMVRRALDCEWYGVAAALCASLLRKAQVNQTNAKGESSRTLLLLKSVADVVSAESYPDYRMRKELCTTCLGLFDSMKCSPSFDVILRFFPILESRTSPYCYMSADTDHRCTAEEHVNHGSSQEDASHEGEARTGEFLVFRAAGLVARRAKNIVDHVKKSTDASQSLDVLRDLSREHGGDPNSAHNRTLSSLSVEVHELTSSLHASLQKGIIDDPSTGWQPKSTEDTMQSLAHQILLWCVSESTLVRTGPMTNLSVCEHVCEMLYIGAAFLLEIHDIQRAQSILAELQKKLEMDASSTLERLAQTTQPSSVVPDEDIVRQLCGRGYSMNGARRSAAMTNNESFSAALSWAIAHFTDEGFDSPLIYVKSVGAPGDGGFVDQKLMQLVRQTLKQLQQVVEEKRQCKSGVPALVAGAPDNSQQRHIQPPPPPPPRHDSNFKSFQNAHQSRGILSQVPSAAPPSQLPRPKSGDNVPSPLPIPKQLSQPSKTSFRRKHAAPPPSEPPSSVLAVSLNRKSALQQEPLKSELSPNQTLQHTNVPPPPRSAPPPPPPPPPPPISLRPTASPLSPLPPKSATRHFPPAKSAPQPKSVSSQPKPGKKSNVNKYASAPIRQNIRPQMTKDIPETKERMNVDQSPGVNSTRKIRALQIPATNKQENPIPRMGARELVSPSESSLFSFEGSVSSRSSLREKGEIARAETKVQSRQLTEDERRRLAMEGRNILEQARKARKVQNPPTTVLAQGEENMEREHNSSADEIHQNITHVDGMNRTTEQKNVAWSVPARNDQQEYSNSRRILAADETTSKVFANETVSESKSALEQGTDGWNFDSGFDANDGYAHDHQRNENISKIHDCENNGDWNFDDEDSMVVDVDKNDIHSNEVPLKSTTETNSSVKVDEGWDFDDNDSILQDETGNLLSTNSDKLAVLDGRGSDNEETGLVNINERTDEILHEPEDISDGWDFDDF